MARCITRGSIVQITNRVSVTGGVRCNWQSNCIRYKVANHCLFVFDGLILHQNKKKHRKLQNVMSLQYYVSNFDSIRCAFYGQNRLKTSKHYWDKEVACPLASSQLTPVTYTWCSVYSFKLLMRDGRTVQNM
jgi:hypothetical protein